VSEQEFIPPKTPKAKFFEGDDPKKDERKGMLSLGGDGKIKSDLIAEPQAAKKGRDIGKNEGESRK
jgi:hypothetical protein